MNYTVVFLALAIAFAGALTWGLKTGSMPAKPLPVSRAEYPGIYWVWGCFWGLVAICCFAACIHQALQAL